MILRSIFLNPLGPALILALGGLALALSYGPSFGPALRASTVDTPMRQRQLDRFRIVLVLRSLFALSVTVVAAFLLVRLRQHPEAGGLSWDWQPLTLAGGVLEWRLDSWNWLLAILLLLITATGLALVGPDWATGPERGRPGARLEWTLWLGAAALCFVFSANVITLVSAWVLLDSAIALRLRPGENPAAASRAWGMLSITALVALLLVATLGEEGVRLSLSSGSLGRLDLALLIFAALVRAGVYPLHYWLTGPALPNASDRVALHLVGPLTGLWLLARVHQVGGVETFRTPLWAAMGVFALFGTALAAWTAADEGARWRWIAINRVSVVILAGYGAAVAGPGAFVWQVLAVALGMAMLALGQSARDWRRWAPLAWFAGLVLWGLPGTVGFLARAVLVFPTGNPLAGPFFALVVIAEIILAAALWQAAVGRPEIEADAMATPRGRLMPAAYEKGLLVGMFAVLAVLAIGWGVWPGRLARLSPWPGGETMPGLGELMRATRRSIWVGLALSGVFGAMLGIWRERIFANMRGWQRLIHDVASLNWLYQAIAGAIGLLMSGLRYFSVLGEGEGYVGWVLLGAFVLWILLRG